jgi:hypothetical protein
MLVNTPLALLSLVPLFGVLGNQFPWQPTTLLFYRPLVAGSCVFPFLLDAMTHQVGEGVLLYSLPRKLRSSGFFVGLVLEDLMG